MIRRYGLSWRRADAGGFDRDGRVLAARAAPEVLLGHEDVAELDLGDELGVEIFHAVLGELLGHTRVEVAGGDDDVGVDIAAVLVRCAVELHAGDLPDLDGRAASAPHGTGRGL